MRISDCDKKELLRRVKELDERTMLRFMVLILLGMNQEAGIEGTFKLIEELKK